MVGPGGRAVAAGWVALWSSRASVTHGLGGMSWPEVVMVKQVMLIHLRPGRRGLHSESVNRCKPPTGGGLSCLEDVRFRAEAAKGEVSLEIPPPPGRSRRALVGSPGLAAAGVTA